MVDGSATNNPSAAFFASAALPALGEGLEALVVPGVAPQPIRTTTPATDSRSRRLTMGPERVRFMLVEHRHDRLVTKSDAMVGAREVSRTAHCFEELMAHRTSDDELVVRMALACRPVNDPLRAMYEAQVLR